MGDGDGRASPVAQRAPGGGVPVPHGQDGWLLGGVAFLALDAALFWLACQMLAINVRSDFMEEEEEEEFLLQRKLMMLGLINLQVKVW